MKKQSKGITLIALVITIIILLILAGISINALTESGLFVKAKNAKEQYSKAEAMEKVQLEVLASYDEKGALDLGKLKENINANLKDAKITETEAGKFPITVEVDGEKFEVKSNGEVSHIGKGTTGGSGTENPVTPADPTLPTNPATSIDIAKTDDMFNKTVNSPIEDANGNKITIPAGFKIKVDDDTNNATTTDKGIVIIDSNENEFVWIPVGKIYTDEAKTEANAKTIDLNRYTFDGSGNPTPQNDSGIDENGYNFEELQTSTYGNTTAKSITDFKNSVTTNKGYYIGRYEARTGTARSSSNKDTITPITLKGTNFVYNWITQPQAADLARNMYDNTKPYTSDLMNSYAWDTATLFLQKCGTCGTPYSMTCAYLSALAITGSNGDVQCNVYNMSSNISEYTTETWCRSKYYSCCRGAHYYISRCR